MITTIIPFFLLANVPGETPFKNGPEIQFTLLSSTTLEESNGVDKYYGYNSTNTLNCRPKNENSLNCILKNIEDVAIRSFNQTAKIPLKEIIIFEPFQFEMKFANDGVEKIIYNKNLTANNTLVETLIRTVANLMRFGLKHRIDLKNSDEQKKDNFLTGECFANYHLNLQDVERTMGEGWNLDFVGPKPKLNGRDLQLTKVWNVSKCNQPIVPMFWIGFIADGVLKDHELKIIQFDGKMEIQYNKFESTTKQVSQREIENGNILTLTEKSTLIFTGVSQSDDEWPEIENAVEVELKDFNLI